MSLKQEKPEAGIRKPGQRATKGRPTRAESDERAIHDALLAAANECIADEKTSNVPVRKIAARAGVNQAMINYYFNDKNGLMLAIFEANFFPLVKKLREFEAECNAPENKDVSIARLMSIIDTHFENSPSLFVLHKDMMDEASGLSRTYSEKNGARGYSTITRIMQRMMDQGMCRTDISPQHAAYVICVLGAVHHVMSPIFDTAFRGLIESERSTELGELATQLLKP